MKRIILAITMLLGLLAPTWADLYESNPVRSYQGVSGNIAPKYLQVAASTTSELADKINISKIPQEIIKGVGKVGEIDSKGEKGPVFVFEEFHTSRVGQLQIAVMLQRLHDQYGLKKIGLEGAVQSEKVTLASDWFHNVGGSEAKTTREDVAVRMLAEGEISAAEFMALVFSDIEVYRIEKQSEYGVELKVNGSPQLGYLIAIAETKLTPSQISKINKLIKQGKNDKAFEYILNSDSWVKQMYERMKKSTGSNMSVEDIVEQIREIKNRAQQLDVDIDSETQEDMEQTLQFFQAASVRSETMVNNALNILQTPGTPVAMIIGAAHTKGVIEKLRSNNVSFVQISPLALNPSYGNLSSEQFERKNEGKWARTGQGTLGSLLNSQRKPPPVIETPSAQSYASMYFAAILIANAPSSDKSLPESIRSQIVSLPEIKIDWDSITRDGDDVIFSALLKDTNGNDKEVWARVGKFNTAEQARDIESKLLQAIADYQGKKVTSYNGGKIPPRKPPTNSVPAKDEGPGDGKRKGVIVNRLDAKTVAAFGRTKDEVNKTGRLSG